MTHTLPPPPWGAVPSLRQLAWHRLETYGFIHFTINTFTDLEWGYGDESPRVFNPTALDTRQWANVAKQGGLKGLILTCKHHDGFCLWPSQYTTHSVVNSPWLNGQGDVVRELADACREFNLKMGIYLSPWDRNHSLYGQPAYVEYYRDQLVELLSLYGPIFEVWHDGANGGDGWYGGSCETRKINPASYYGWLETWGLVRLLQPEAAIFCDAGGDIRWVGNEAGIGSETTWCTFNPAGRYPGYPDVSDMGNGHEGGSHWAPPETDVSIRPGWFYHAHEDESVKSISQLVDIYFKSVGRGTSLLLNLPPDRRGLINEIDASRVRVLHEILERTFEYDLAPGAMITASNTRGPDYAAACLVDNNPETYWAAEDRVTNAQLIFEFKHPIVFNIFQAQEYIALGQRVRAWRLEAQTPDGNWLPVTEGTTIGYKRLARFTAVTAQRVRFSLQDCAACPVLSSISLFYNPDLSIADSIQRS
jgi:alpha-L-fucosidase